MSEGIGKSKMEKLVDQNDVDKETEGADSRDMVKLNEKHNESFPEVNFVSEMVHCVSSVWDIKQCLLSLLQHSKCIDFCCVYKRGGEHVFADRTRGTTHARGLTGFSLLTMQH